MMLYTENPKETITKLLELISDCSKVGGTRLMHRNQLDSYILTMKNQKEKLWNQSHSSFKQNKIKYLGINLPKETKDLYTETYDTGERNQRQHKQMERHSVFPGRKNQYCESHYTAKCKLQIQCDPNQIPTAFFTELEQKVSQFIWKHAKDPK